MARVLVTGACGFVGPSVCNLGILLGHDVFATDVGTQYKEYLSPAVKLKIGVDIRDPSQITSYIREVQPDIILHVAALFKYHGLWEIFESINIHGTKNVMEAALQIPKLKKVIVWSSGSVYGKRCKTTRKLDETEPCEPRNFYEKSKLLAEQTALKYKDKIPVTVIRPAAIYGSGIEFGGPAGTYGALKVIQLIFKNQLNGVPGSGKNRFGFIHVEDIARIAYFLAESEDQSGEIYNTIDDSDYTLEALVTYVADWIRKHNIPINFSPKIHFPLSVIYALGLWCEILAKIQKREPTVERPFLTFFKPGYNFLMSNDKLKALIQKTEGKRQHLLGSVIKYRDILKDGGMDYNLEWCRRRLLCS